MKSKISIFVTKENEILEHRQLSVDSSLKS